MSLTTQIAEFQREASKLMAKTMTAAGIDAQGERVSLPVFPDFAIPDLVRFQTKSAIADFAAGNFRGAMDGLHVANLNLMGSQAAYLRRRCPDLLFERAKKLMGQVSTKEIDEVYQKIRDFEGKWETGWFKDAPPATFEVGQLELMH